MRHAALALAVLLGVAGTGAAHAADDAGLVFASAKYRDRAQLQTIASRFQHVIVDPATRTVRFEASREDIEFLRRAGVGVEVDRAATRRMREAEAAMGTGGGEVGTQSISGYPCYRTVEETYATMDAIARAHPNLARVVEIGPSWARSRNAGAGYPMRVLRLTNSATDASISKANMVLLASIHAREYTPAELLTRFGEWLVDHYGVNGEATWLLDNFRFHLVLQGNPDGRKKAESGLSWRKNINDSNGVCSANAHGIDLNRNFPYRWNASSGSSGDPCASTYRGPSAASEPETANLIRYIAGVPNSSGVYTGGVLPDRRGDGPTAPAPGDYRGMFVDLHSYSRLVLWPWSYTTSGAPNASALRTLGRRIAHRNGYSPRQWTGLYVADGTNTDAVYGLLGAPSYTIELGVSFFESCSTFESSTLPLNLAALRYAARSLRAPYVYPSGPDTSAIGVSPMRVTAGTPVTVTATVDDGAFNQSNGSEPVQAIASARAYLNQRPWTPNATAYAMSATDGAFSTSRESVRTTIPTSGLRIGRHQVFVRGSDASGRVGTPQAVLFTVAGTRNFGQGRDVAVPDRGTGTSSIAVSGVQGTAPTALSISVDIRHPNIGDLVIDLTAPGGTTYRLHSRTGGTTDNLVTTYTRDASSETANGTWRLRVTDQVSGNVGYINWWRLRFTY